MAKDKNLEEKKARSSKKTEKKSESKPKSQKERFNALKKIGNFFKDSMNEVKKIVWPDYKTVFKNMGIVLVVILIIGLFVFLLDSGLIALLSKFMGVSGS
jgi:preprotein translocase subunit SecE